MNHMYMYHSLSMGTQIRFNSPTRRNILYTKTYFPHAVFPISAVPKRAHVFNYHALPNTLTSILFEIRN